MFRNLKVISYWASHIRKVEQMPDAASTKQAIDRANQIIDTNIDCALVEVHGEIQRGSQWYPLKVYSTTNWQPARRKRGRGLSV